MDRLFSKLQLGDIKVGEKSSFPPDAEPYEESEQTVAAATPPASAEAEIEAGGLPEEPPHDAATGEATASHPQSTVGDEAPAAPVTPRPEPEDRMVQANGRPYRPGYGQGVPENRGEILKVSSRSRPSAVAGAIAGVVRENGRAEVQAIGAGAANQAIKAVAIARDYLNETGIEAICLPSLVDLTIDEADRTAIRLVVETR